jgi:hypothetical protein
MGNHTAVIPDTLPEIFDLGGRPLLQFFIIIKGQSMCLLQPGLVAGYACIGDALC